MSPRLQRIHSAKMRASRPRPRRAVATAVRLRTPRAQARMLARTVLLVDIGSASAGAALVELVPGGRPVTLAQRRVPLKISAARFAAEIEVRLEAAAREALQSLGAPASGRAISNAAVFLPAPWSSLALHTVRFSEDRAFVASPLLMDRMIAAHVEDEERLEQGRAQAARGEVYERQVAGLRLNGYVSPALPDGTDVFSVEMMLAASRAPAAFLSRMLKAVGEFVPGAELSAHSSILSAAHALTGIAPDPRTFLVCDGEGELAEFLAVRESIPEAHATVPVGYASILRTIGLHGGYAPEEIPSLLALMRDPRSPMSGAAREALELATGHCADALSAAEPICRACAPRLCYVVGEGPEAAWFASALKRSTRLRLALPKDFEVRIVTSAALEGRTDAAYGQGAGDPMLSLHALFAADRFGRADVQHFYS